MVNEALDIAEKLSLVSEHWSPKVVWHTHDDTDVVLCPGQMYVVLRGVEHCPIADGEVHAVLIEPVGVVNTGNAGGDLTAKYDDSLMPPAD